MANSITLRRDVLPGQAATQVSESNRLVSGRARQLIHLKSFSMWLEWGYPTLVDEDFYRGVLVLQVMGRDHQLTPDAFLPPAAPSSQGLIDYIYSQVSYQELTAVGAYVEQLRPIRLTRQVDLLVPALWLWSSVFAANNPTLLSGASVEYEWVSASADQIAATLLHWGQDSSDFDRG